MKVTRDEALALSMGLLEGRDTPAKCALLQSDILVEAELRGHPSHGLQRLPRLLTRIERGLTDPRTEGMASWRSDAALEVDGMNGLGPVIAFAALRHLETRVATSGVALAAIRNSNHLGMLACYVEQIASWGCIGIAMSSSEALVHPHGGTRAMLGTNPIAIAVPTAERPMVLDLATSTVSMGKIHHYAANGMPLPSGWARDAAGRPTSSAAAAKQGSIAPFGGAKGYGLGLAVELVVAALAGSELAPNVRGTLDAEFVCNKGDVLIAIHLGHAPDLAAKLSAYLELIRRSPPADPEQPVSIPGDGAALRRAIALEQGFEIEPQLWRDLHALSRTSVFEGHSA
ncbi:Ldh family oxidoreductase [Mesorhizobium sp. BAC0120]|uniref:Ldh family oxidoreductase n=1 Tax=Mesorhizobium sp. BAC0120 TaxID=3090670 RepID=UPI00298BE84C|nr:Ldh family oxidoreductase [Mesorhizobium sp. BAC0120]MDW6024141.1 Ldh family oxidoreductase [Mesorhizobium sp. BAC0120]